MSLHEKVRDVEVLSFACPDCERRLHVMDRKSARVDEHGVLRIMPSKTERTSHHRAAAARAAHRLKD